MKFTCTCSLSVTALHVDVCVISTLLLSTVGGFDFANVFKLSSSMFHMLSLEVQEKGGFSCVSGKGTTRANTLR